ncbi:MAG TPA: magnesium transporter CorA family protein [Rhodopila sp.]|nr:magnesium transporter CorA family protein [Rhodopila sp.]
MRASVWIDLVRPDPVEIEQVARATQLHVPTEAEVSEIESSSRLVTRQGVLYLSLPLINRSDGPHTTSAGFVLSRTHLMTVRFHDSRLFDGFADQVPHGEIPQETAAHVLVSLLEAIVDRQADVLEQVRADLDTMSNRIFAMGTRASSGRKQEDAALRAALGEIGRIGDLLSHVRDTQMGIARLVPYVQSVARSWLPADLAPRLDTLSQDIASIGSFDIYVSEKLQFLLDATLGFINIAQNNVMKVLTVASVVGIPPVLVAGIYGMNFKYMPELGWTWGYAFGWAMIILTALIPLAVFRWRKWI